MKSAGTLKNTEGLVEMARKFNRTQRKRGGGTVTGNNNMGRSIHSRRSKRSIKPTEKANEYRKERLERLEKKVSAAALRKLKQQTTAELDAALAGLAKLGL